MLTPHHSNTSYPHQDHLSPSSPFPHTSKIQSDLCTSFSLEKLNFHRLNDIYNLNGSSSTFAERWDEEHIALQNNPQNLQALSTFFTQQEIWDIDIDMSYVESLPAQFHFPQKLKGNLDLSWLKQLPETLKLPSRVGGLSLKGIRTLPASVLLPEWVEKSLYLENITKLEPCTHLPKYIGDKLVLNSLVEFPPHSTQDSSQNVIWPEYVKVLELRSVLNVFDADYIHLNGHFEKLFLSDRTARGTVAIAKSVA